jgi:hypothetical protein
MLTLSDTQVTLERNVHLNPTDLLAHVQSFADNSARIATTVPSLTAVPHRSALLEPTAPLPQPSPANIATTPRINAATPPHYADSARFQVWPRLTAIAGEMVGLALLAQIPAVLIVLLIVLTTH